MLDDFTNNCNMYIFLVLSVITSTIHPEYNGAQQLNRVLMLYWCRILFTSHIEICSYKFYLVAQSIFKSINIISILHHSLSNFKIEKPNKMKVFHCYSLAV